MIVVGIAVWGVWLLWQKLLRAVWGVWQLRLGSVKAGCWGAAVLDWSGCAFLTDLGGLKVVGL